MRALSRQSPTSLQPVMALSAEMAMGSALTTLRLATGLHRSGDGPGAIDGALMGSPSTIAVSSSRLASLSTESLRARPTADVVSQPSGHATQPVFISSATGTAHGGPRA